MKKILTIIGTRPEAIKLASVVCELQKNINFENKVCLTMQHRELLTPFLQELNIKADYQLKYENGSLINSCAQILTGLEDVFAKFMPDLVVVQGDTTTAFASSLAAFYSKIPIAHIEAGLRTGDIYSPWPEESHRIFTDKVSSYLFTPTIAAKDNLIKEGFVDDKIWVVGNTVIDLLIKTRQKKNIKTEKSILVTVHRRENHGSRLGEVCNALCEIANLFPEFKIICILHSNPSVNEHLKSNLSNKKNIKLIEPMDHFSFVNLMREVYFIVTDSGGIQEEAAVLGKPVVVIRELTERQEGVEMGTSKLVGTKKDDIVNCCSAMIKNKQIISEMSKVHFSYGDGRAGEKIVEILTQVLCDG